MTSTMTAAELTAHVELKFSGPYIASAVLVKWDTETETAEFLVTYRRGFTVYPDLTQTIYAQGWQADGNPVWQGAATSSYPFTTRQDARYYVEVL